MSIKTGRTEGHANVSIRQEDCISCGLCIKVCSGAPLHFKDNNTVQVDHSRLFGCIACGHCVAVCPNNCITVSGRTLSPEDFFSIPQRTKRSNYDQLLSLMVARRSIRRFEDKSVEKEQIDRIVEAVSSAPMGLPPSDVEVLIFNGKVKVQEFAGDLINLMSKYKWLFGPFGRFFFRPFLGKVFVEQSKTFLHPLLTYFKSERKKGVDLLFHHAPLVMYFHVSPYADPVDPLVSATYAMLTAETLGLGTCMIGTPAQFLKYSKKTKKKYGIPLKNHQGIAVIFGYPEVKYNKSIKRSLGKVKYFTKTM